MAIINAITIESPMPVSGTVSANIPNQTAFQVQSITVTTAGTPVQGPSLAVPNTVAVAVQNPSTNPNNTVLYIANSSANALLAASRMELKRGESIALYISNVDLIWLDSNNSGAIAKILVEA